ncbi:MAG: lysylphosphatidylglycerol synthase transmembrane domain-containing protein [Cytophaga sp.]|uniref:lysylphosphatidylglycerol synthase transmembrane domain-containing protein n=1 Tax=Cytophaga sp. TaxID=29535 RepID=UPI003F7D8E0C
MNRYNQPYVKLLLKLIITGIALGFVFMHIPMHDLIAVLSQANALWLAIALMLFTCSKYISAARFHDIFSNAGIKIPRGYNFKLYLLGMLYNFMLPSGVGGDAYKVIKIERDFGYKTQKVTLLILFDRISGLIALSNIAGILLILFLFGNYFIVLSLALMLLNVMYYATLSKLVPVKIFSIKTEMLSWTVQLFQSLCAYCIIRSLSIEQHVWIYILIFLISSIVAVIPLTIGGLGAREYTFMIAANYFMIQTDKAVCIGLLFYIITLLISSLGIYFIFKPINKTCYAQS